jgi:hypothetical protein
MAIMARREKMANTNEYVTKLVGAKATPENKGLEMTIKIVAYDNGLINVNGNPIGKGRTNQWLSTSRFIAQMLEKFEADVRKRQTQNAA